MDKAAMIEAVNRNWTCLPVDSISDVEEWRRGGSETYICVSEIARNGNTEKIVGKAFVGWGAQPVEQQAHWEQRRTILNAVGIPVPKLFATYPGMSIEQFIGEELEPTTELQPNHLDQLGRIVGILVSEGFDPINPLADIRVENGTLFYVDFGSDLGGSDSSSSSVLDRVRALLRPDQLVIFDAGVRARGLAN